MPVGLSCLSCLRVMSQRHQTRFHAVRPPRTGRADSYGPRPVLSVASVRQLPQKSTSPIDRRPIKTRFPKASGLWWVGFREGKALSDLAPPQPTPSKPLAFPPPPPLNSAPCVKFRVASAWIMGFPPLLPPARYLGFDLFAPGREGLPCAAGIVQGKPYLTTQPIDCPGKTLSWP